MTLLIVLTVLAVAGLVATVRSALHDAPAARPRSHRTDLDFVAPAARSSYDRIA
ncbi:hypothetical protein [Nocardioides litoris]|uniref:hypothetical protein n=1 Tax=Nocardioides litoris TaxID=1926648 RepID=UPI0014777C64|nr:hypothetical protein [Nocardioides litoris]